MKTLVIAAAALLLASCNSQEAPKGPPVNEVEASVASYLSGNMHNPQSLEVELTSAPLALDTIKNKSLFPGKQEGSLVTAKYRGQNPLGATVLSEAVFFLSPDGNCYYSLPIDRLSSDEFFWVYTYQNSKPE